MAKKSAPSNPKPPPAPAPESAQRPAVTAERFRRLVRLVQYLGTAARTRAQLLAHLRLDIRGFYRDLELLRSVDVSVTLARGAYHLAGAVDDVLPRLPFPDPHLTLGEARHLARGRSRLHQRLQREIDALLS